MEKTLKLWLRNLLAVLQVSCSLGVSYLLSRFHLKLWPPTVTACFCPCSQTPLRDNCQKASLHMASHADMTGKVWGWGGVTWPYVCLTNVLTAQGRENPTATEILLHISPGVKKNCTLARAWNTGWLPINVSWKSIEWAEWAASLCTANSPFLGHVYCRHPGICWR